MIKYLLHKLHKRIPALVLLVLSHVGSALFCVVFSLGTKGVIDAAVSGSRQDLLRAGMVQAGIVFGILFFGVLYRWLNNELSAVLDRDWKQKLFHTVLRGDYANLSEFHTGELINRINNDVRLVNDGLLATLPGVAGMITRLVAVVAVMAAMEPWLLVVMAAVGVVAVCATAIARKKLQTLNKRVSASDGKLSGFLQEIFEKLLLVQASGVETEVERRADGLMEHRYGLQKRRRRISVLSHTSVSFLTNASSFFALVWSAFGVFNGTMTFGDLTALTHLVGQLQGPFVSLSGVFPQYVAMTAACERLMELEAICTAEEQPQKVDPWPLYRDMIALEAEDLTFSYGRDQVLHSSTFRLPKGAFAVVTGPSGVGKSTLLRLLLGIYRPDGGKLTVAAENGNIPISASTRSLFAYVPQGNLLLSGTLRENLTLMKPDATEEELRQAVYISCMDEYLTQLPDGLETVLGENAHGLSEGQAQRLAIARAVLGGAPILLLDEVTSALDEQTERTVLQRLRQLPDRTCIAVTHRPAALELADWQLQVDENGIQSLSR